MKHSPLGRFAGQRIPPNRSSKGKDPESEIAQKCGDLGSESRLFATVAPVSLRGAIPNLACPLQKQVFHHAV